MTIYAIVNNLLRDSYKNDIKEPVWTLISQSGILQGGNPYFVPDFAQHFEARIALAVRIGRLGKGIAPRFAHRYVDGAAPCVIFIPSDLLQKLREQGHPWTSALSYDRCLAIGNFTPASIEDCNHSEIKLTIESADDATTTVWTSDSALHGIGEILATLSRDNTIKTGDIILLGISGEGPEAIPDTRASLSLNGTDRLKFNIR